MSKHLFRTWYQTDATRKETNYMGTQSETIPDRALEDGRTIVDVRWDYPSKGWVQVTYLSPGPGATHNDGLDAYPWVNPQEGRKVGDS